MSALLQGRAIDPTVTALPEGARRPGKCGYRPKCYERPDYRLVYQFKRGKPQGVRQTAPLAPRETLACVGCARDFATNKGIDFPEPAPAAVTA